MALPQTSSLRYAEGRVDGGRRFVYAAAPEASARNGRSKRTTAEKDTEKNGRGRAALTRSNWGRSTFRASWKLWAPATLVSVAFFDHAAETLTQYTSKSAQAKDALASPCCKGLSSGTAARKASRRSTEMRGLTTVTRLGRRGRRRLGLEPREDALDPRRSQRRLVRLIDAQQPIQGRGGREDADARHPAPFIAAAPEQRHGALLSISIPEVPLVRPARDAQPRQRVREQ